LNEAGEQPQEINVDQLLADIEAPAAERPMSAGETPPAEGQAPAPEGPTWNGSEWEFEVSGKKVVPESRDKLKIWASQGYNYSQRMGELNRTHAERLAAIQAQELSLKEKYSGYDRYQTIDDYARENPQWWEHVQKNYQTRDTFAVDEKLQPILNPIVERLSKTESMLTEWQQQQQAKQESEKLARDNEALDAEIKAIRDEYPNIDLSAADPETGETLELQIYKHATKIGTSSFAVAFRDYLHPKLIDMARASALENAAKDKQKQVKNGVLGQTSAPVKGLKPTVNTKAAWNDPQFDAQNILQEMGMS
jgi:hypothetical protein